MKRLESAGAVALASLVSVPALAGALSFISVAGDDARNCATPATACRTFQRAHDATSPHGEIIALTPGDYRAVTIAKSISVTGVAGAGIFGGAGGSNQITISAGAGVVYLTGLTLDGASTVDKAISVGEAAVVTIRHCSIRDTVGNSVSAPFTEVLRLLIEDTSLSRGNDNMNLEGRALVHRVVSTGTRASAIVSPSGSPLTISETSAAASRDGVFIAGPVFMTRSAVTGNSRNGMDSDFTSAGDNFIRGNGTNVSGTITNIGRQ
jgi:hypothetical protein